MEFKNEGFVLTDKELERVSGGLLESGYIMVYCSACRETFVMEEPACSLNLADCPKCGAHDGCLSLRDHY